MSMLKFESAFEFRREFPSRFPLHASASFLRKPIYGVVLTSPFALHPLGLPVAASSLPELRDTQGDGGCELE